MATATIGKPTATQRRIRIRVFGLVRGVFFRAAARDVANNLGLPGFARNEPDGSVTLEAQGKPADLKRFAAWCRRGPPGAHVERLETESTDQLAQSEGFGIY
jgi:acylphosphatase